MITGLVSLWPATHNKRITALHVWRCAGVGSEHSQETSANEWITVGDTATLCLALIPGSWDLNPYSPETSILTGRLGPNGLWRHVVHPVIGIVPVEELSLTLADVMEISCKDNEWVNQVTTLRFAALNLNYKEMFQLHVHFTFRVWGKTSKLHSFLLVFSSEATCRKCVWTSV